MIENRREFLKAALGASALLALNVSPPLALGKASRCARKASRCAHKAPRRARKVSRVLVVVQLSGGNDGLNTIVPHGDDAYGRNRPTIRLPERKLHRIDDHLGFHPRMEALSRLYREGTVAIIQGVGYPDSSRDHGVSLRTWHTAAPADRTGRTGWLGRVADRIGGPSGIDVPALFVSPSSRPLAVRSERTHVAKIRSLDDVAGSLESRAVPAAAPGTEIDPLLEFVREKSAETETLRRTLRTISDEQGSASDYPGFRLAADLRTVAQLIRADLGIPIFFTELGGDGFGGFDNHANQIGNHCALLHQLSESVAAFVRDLAKAKLLDRVLLMTFSEFGRTLAENGRRGTGHGEAAPVLLAGGRLRGGLTGKHPSLTDLEQGAPRFHTDFRRLYATALEEWLGFESEAVLGGRFEPLKILAT